LAKLTIFVLSNNKNIIDMKTNYFSTKKISIYSIFGLIVFVATSCGSYQNKSYYDNDGIYSNAEKKIAETVKPAEESKYKDYFYNMQRNGTDPEVLTNVDSYSSIKDTVSNNNVNNDSSNSSYSGWGSAANDTVTINIYGNNWGYNNYWGHPNYWYGPSWNWGWGYNNYWYGGYYGWSHPYYGYYGNPYYGYGYGYNGYYYGNNYNNGYTYSYQGGHRRGGASGNYINNNGFYGRGNNTRDNISPRGELSAPRSNIGGTRDNITPRGQQTYSDGTPRNVLTPRSNTNPRSESIGNPVRDYDNTGSNPRSNNPRPTYSNPRSNTNTEPVQSEPRPTYSNPRSNTTTEPAPRSYTPTRSESSNSSPRSYSPSPSSGGGNSGGGRSGGGGRR